MSYRIRKMGDRHRDREKKEKNIWLEVVDPAVFVRADSKGVTGVTVCKCRK
jgi:hypothetical protein